MPISRHRGRNAVRASFASLLAAALVAVGCNPPEAGVANPRAAGVRPNRGPAAEKGQAEAAKNAAK
jgi:hypothetical protein